MRPHRWTRAPIVAWLTLPKKRYSVLRRSLRHGSPMGLPGPYYILRGVVVSMQACSALRATMPADGQAFRNHNATARAPLARECRRHGYYPPTGPCCLVRKKVRELAPRDVMDAFGKTMVVRHPLDREVFNSNQVKGVDDMAAVLMGEVAAPPRNPFMDASYHFALSGALRRPLLLLGQATLGLGKRLFVTTEEARVGNHLLHQTGWQRYSAPRQSLPLAQWQAGERVQRTRRRSRRTTCRYCCG